jgi:hypothetical protein
MAVINSGGCQDLPWPGSGILKQKTSETVSQNYVNYSSSSTKLFREPMLCSKEES